MAIGRCFTFLFNFFARLHFVQHAEDVLVCELFGNRPLEPKGSIWT
jgi:hypothetical protein